MATVPVVEVVPDGQCGAPLLGVLVGAAISPLTKRGLDESLGLAIGLRAIGPGELLRDAPLEARGAEGCRVECRAVVGQDALNGDLQAGEVARGLAHEVN